VRRWERLAGRPKTEARSLDDWTSLFGQFYGGQYGGGLTGAYGAMTTMGAINQERLPLTSVGAYRGSSPVFALVQARIQVFSQARFQWTRFKGGKPTDLFGTPELGILERPWPNGVTSDLLGRMELDASYAGNSYIRRGNRMLHRLNPFWTTIVVGSQEDADNPAQAPDAVVAGYLYQPPNGPMRYFLPEECAHYAPIPDPLTNYLGMSWMTPVIHDVMGDSAMTEHKLAYFTNAGTPNLAIKFDPSVTLDQVKQFKELMETEHAGVANAYKTLFLGGGADTTVIGSDMKQLDFAVSQGKGESRMAAAAGVPASWVGFSEGLQGSSLNAGNFTSARRRFSDGTVAHLWSNVASSLDPIIARPSNPSDRSKPDTSVSLWYDVSSAPFMREDESDLATIQSMQATTLNSLVMAGYTADSAVDAVVNNDLKRLVHSGLTSVQLFKPGQVDKPAAIDQGTGGGA
jgi:hypothetical protein